MAMDGSAVEAPRSDEPCPTCGGSQAGAPPVYVYAIGRIEARFPTPSIEREFAQAAGRQSTDGLTDAQLRHSLLSAPEGRYLLRRMCWVLSVEGLETYVLAPRDTADYALLADAVRERPQRTDLDLVIGTQGRIAPPEYCNGLQVPLVVFDQIYSFDRASLLASIPRPAGAGDGFDSSAEELFDRLMQVADNSGATDEHRALNYLAVRYQRMYEVTADAHRDNKTLTAVETSTSRLSGTRNVVNVVFVYTHRSAGYAEKHFVRVDVTEEFPFLVTPMSPYFDRP